MLFNSIKQFILICIFLINIFIFCFAVSDKNSVLTLQNRLSKINNVYVYFSQKISSVDKNIFREYQGEIWIKRPNLFYWHMIYPEESFLISDGQKLWFYIPAIQQVTIYCAKKISDNIFLMLFINNDISIRNYYDVSQKGDYFFLQSICNNINIKECKIKITNYGIIKQFSFIEYNGEYIDYYFSKQNNDEIDVTKFSFNIPKDIQLDDQRE